MMTAATIDVPTLIDEQKVGSFQTRILILCALAALLDGFAAQMIGYVAPSVAREMRLSPAALTPVFAWGLFGLMLGALIFGPVADRFGRKPVIVACTLFYGLITLATARADSGASLAILRFLAGLGFGGVMPNAIALTAEYSPHRRRATMITIMFCGFPVGASIAGFATVPILQAFSWRGVFVLAGIMPLLLVPVLAVMLPESIRHLVIHGGDSARVAELLRRINAQMVFPSGTNFVVREERAAGLAVIHLFRQGRAIATILLWIGFFMSLIDIYLLTSWLPTVFHNAGITLSLAVIATAVFQGGGVVASLMLGSLGIILDPTVWSRSLIFWEQYAWPCSAIRIPSRPLWFARSSPAPASSAAKREQRAGRFVLPDVYSLHWRRMGAGNWPHRIDCRPDLRRHHALPALAADHRLRSGCGPFAHRRCCTFPDGPRAKSRKCNRHSGISRRLRPKGLEGAAPLRLSRVRV